MLDNGIITPSNSKWQSPVILVKEESGSYCFAVNYRKLNAFTKPMSFPLPWYAYGMLFFFTLSHCLKAKKILYAKDIFNKILICFVNCVNLNSAMQLFIKPHLTHYRVLFHHSVHQKWLIYVHWLIFIAQIFSLVLMASCWNGGWGSIFA